MTAKTPKIPYIVRIWYRTAGDEIVCVDSDPVTRQQSEVLEAEALEYAVFAKAFKLTDREKALGELEESKPDYTATPRRVSSGYKDGYHQYKNEYPTVRGIWAKRWKSVRLPEDLAREIKQARLVTLPHQRV